MAEITLTAAERDELAKRPLKIAVVGHTTHGKTSTIRTLTEDASWGTITHEPGATIKVEGKRSGNFGATMFIVFDTVGFESLADLIYETRQAEGKDDNWLPSIPRLIEQLQTSTDADAKKHMETLMQIRECDFILQVIKTTEPIKQDYRDEITLLQHCGIPVLFCLNFTHDKQSQKQKWIDYFRKDRGLHSFVEFDAHTREWECEHQLFEKMKADIHDPLYRRFLDAWLVYRRRFIDEAIRGSAIDLAELIESLALYRECERNVDKQNKSRKLEQLAKRFEEVVNKRKNDGLEKILGRFRFKWEDIDNQSQSMGSTEFRESLFRISLFDPSYIKWAATAVGAVTGLALDATFGFLTFGVLTVVGGAVGYFSASAYEFSTEKGSSEISIGLTSNPLVLLTGLGVSLARSLMTRGRANPTNIPIFFSKDAFKPTKEFSEAIDGLIKERKAILPMGRVNKTKLIEEIESAIRS